MKWIMLAATVVVAGMAIAQKPSFADTDEYYPWCNTGNGSCTYKTLADSLRDRVGGSYQCYMNSSYPTRRQLLKSEPPRRDLPRR